MGFDDYLTDAKLHIETTGRDDTCSDDQIYPYEPTTYTVLYRLADGGYITEKDHLIDYGSGMGRVPICMHEKTGCRATGVEMVRKFHEKALQNLEKYAQGRDCAVEFCCQMAQKFVLPPTANRLFFFNPFHLKTFKNVMTNVLESYRQVPRNIRLFLYYPQDSFIAYLSGLAEVVFYDEIDCRDLFEEQDDRNRIMIFEIPS